MIKNKIKKTSKDQAVPVHAMKAYNGSSCIAPLILKLGTRRKQVIKLMFWPTYPPPPTHWGNNPLTSAQLSHIQHYTKL